MRLMKIVDGTWSVVIVGKWNRYILTPEWIGKKIFEQDEFEVQFPVNRPELAPRYKSSNNILFMPAIHKCQFIAQPPYDNDMLTKMSSYIRKLVTILEHTPVTAFGNNFGFEVDSDKFGFLGLFNLADTGPFLGKRLDPTTTEIKRQFPIDKHFLNFTIIHNQEKVNFDFNFHYNVSQPTEIAELVTDTLIIENKQKAYEILQEIYQLDLADDEGVDE